MPKQQSDERKAWEGVKLPLMTSLVRADLVELRIRQAIERFGCVDLLGPALRGLREMRQDTHQAIETADSIVAHCDWFKGDV